MKIASPFMEYIPDCKRNMRRLRKKIYKFMTSRHYTQKNDQNKIDFSHLLSNKNIPIILIDNLSKKKTIDLNTIKNVHINQRISIEDIRSLTLKQQKIIQVSHKQWIESNKLRKRQKQLLRQRQFLGKQSFSSILSSTQNEQQSIKSYSFQLGQDNQDYNQLDESLNRPSIFNPFVRQNGFPQIQSSLMSQDRIFTFFQQ